MRQVSFHNSANIVAQRRRSMAVIEMTESLQRVGEQPLELSVEERILLSVAYGSTAGCRRATWRIITSVEQKEKFKGMEQQASHAREYVAKVEDEIQRIRDGIPALMDENLIPSASTGESKELYQIHVDQTAQKTSEIPKLQFDDVPVVLVTQFPRVQVEEEAVEIPQFQVDKKLGVIPETIRVETTAVEVEKMRS